MNRTTPENSPSRRTNARTAMIAIGFLIVGLFLAAPGLASDRWFHVRVEEDSGAEVNVNLPLSLIESAIKLVPEEAGEEVYIELNEEGFDVDELRQLWQEVRNTADATFLTVKDHGTTVEVRKEGNYFVAETVEGTEYGAQVNVRFPLEVVDALFSGPRGTLDLAAAIRALAEVGDGDMVTIQDRDARVRVWVDDSN